MLDTDTGFRYENIIVDQIYDENDDKGIAFKKVTDLAGQTWKVKSGQEGKLKAKWGLLIHGKALRLTIAKYKGFDYVADLDSITDLAEAEATRRLQMMMRDIKNEVIEAYQAARMICDLEIADKPLTPERIKARDNWLDHALRNYAEVKVE